MICILKCVTCRRKSWKEGGFYGIKNWCHKKFKDNYRHTQTDCFSNADHSTRRLFGVEILYCSTTIQRTIICPFPSLKNSREWGFQGGVNSLNVPDIIMQYIKFYATPFSKARNLASISCFFAATCLSESSNVNIWVPNCFNFSSSPQRLSSIWCRSLSRR